MIRIVLMLIMGMTTLAHAELVKKTIEYKQGDAVLEGYLVYNDDQLAVQKPGVLVVHEWMGLNDYAKSRADQLAQLGYVAFAADIYGKGIRPSTVEAASGESSKYKADRALLRARVLTGLNELKAQGNVDVSKIAAIGYCFGGTTVLELARSGEELNGVVSFHGGLAAGNIPDENIKTKILVLHGADDPFVPQAEVEGFEKEMKDQGANYTLVKYPGAVHGFTNPNNKGAIPGALYEPQADAQSWEAMKEFFKAVGL